MLLQLINKLFAAIKRKITMTRASIKYIFAYTVITILFILARTDYWNMNFFTNWKDKIFANIKSMKKSKSKQGGLENDPFGKKIYDELSSNITFATVEQMQPTQSMSYSSTNSSMLDRTVLGANMR